MGNGGGWNAQTRGGKGGQNYKNTNLLQHPKKRAARYKTEHYCDIFCSTNKKLSWGDRFFPETVCGKWTNSACEITASVDAPFAGGKMPHSWVEIK